MLIGTIKCLSSFQIKLKRMKKIIVLAVVVSVVFSSCTALKETECRYVKRSYVGYK